MLDLKMPRFMCSLTRQSKLLEHISYCIMLVFQQRAHLLDARSQYSHTVNGVKNVA